MILIRDLHLQYGEKVIFENLNFSIKPNDKIGLIGRNGAGKTSLFNIIAKELTPDSGHVEFPTNIRLSFLKQHLETNSKKPIIEETLSVISNARELDREIEEIQQKLEAGSEMDEAQYQKIIIRLSDLHEQSNNAELLRGEAEVILKGLGFKQKDLEMETNTFSGGWKMRVELAKILIQKPNYILLDEPGNYLDIESVVWFEKYLNSYSGAFMVISHDQDFLDNCTETTLELSDGQLFTYQCAYTKAMIERAERIQNQLSSFSNQQKKIQQKQRTIDRFRAKSSKRNMVKSMEKQLAKMELVEVDQEQYKNMSIQFNESPRSGEVVIKTSGLCKSYGDNVVFKDLDFQLLRGEKLALVGKNGEGKSTLINIISEKVDKSGGSYELGYNVFPGYFFQDHPEKLDNNLTVYESLEAESPPELRTRLRSILGAFLFSGEDIDKKVKVLSGGERSRLALATLLMKPYNLLILDEPTNHLDIPSKHVLKEALKKFNGSLLIVSHDRQFLRDLSEKTIEMSNGKVVEFIGDVDEFLRKKNAESFREFETTKKANKTGESSDDQTIKKVNANRKVIKELRRKIQYSERKINDLEDKLARVEKEMTDVNFYEDPSHTEKVQFYKEKKIELKSLYTNWEEMIDELARVAGQ